MVWPYGILLCGIAASGKGAFTPATFNGYTMVNTIVTTNATLDAYTDFADVAMDTTWQPLQSISIVTIGKGPGYFPCLMPQMLHMLSHQHNMIHITTISCLRCAHSNLRQDTCAFLYSVTSLPNKRTSSSIASRGARKPASQSAHLTMQAGPGIRAAIKVSASNTSMQSQPLQSSRRMMCDCGDALAGNPSYCTTELWRISYQVLGMAPG